LAVKGESWDQIKPRIKEMIREEKKKKKYQIKGSGVKPRRCMRSIQMNKRA